MTLNVPTQCLSPSNLNSSLILPRLPSPLLLHQSIPFSAPQIPPSPLPLAKCPPEMEVEETSLGEAPLTFSKPAPSPAESLADAMLLAPM